MWTILGLLLASSFGWLAVKFFEVPVKKISESIWNIPFKWVRTSENLISSNFGSCVELITPKLLREKASKEKIIDFYSCKAKLEWDIIAANGDILRDQYPELQNIIEQLVPLAKLSPDDPTTVEVFECCINGQEIAPAYTEQNDPIAQRERLEHQAGGEQQKLDEDFLVALEHGMPPAGGMGMGIDRLCMMLLGQESIRDVILFPQLKPK